MKKALQIFAFFCFALSYSQKKSHSIIVMDAYKSPLEGVELIRKDGAVLATSNCEGNLSWTYEGTLPVELQKKNYIGRELDTKLAKKKKIVLQFDPISLENELRDHYEREFGPIIDSVVNKKGAMLPYGGQALFFLDGQIYRSSEKLKLEPDEIATAEVFKGQKAMDIFGKWYTRNGVIWITTTCEYRESKKQ